MQLDLLGTAFIAMLVSAVFFVGGKVVMARFSIPWVAYWRWSLGSASLLGLIGYVALGAPAVPGWQWCLFAGMVGSFAHVLANTALSWGEASLLIPVSGAKPVVLLAVVPLVTGVAVSGDLTWACLLATVGVMISGFAPRTVHRHAPRPTIAFFLMMLATACMATSDVFGKVGLDKAKGMDDLTRYGSIACWNMGLGILPLLSFAIPHWRSSPAARIAGGIQGAVFALYIVLMSVAFQLAKDPAQAVAAVNVVVSLRGVTAVLLIMAIDRWMKLGLEPVPRWVHGLRLAGAMVLVLAVALAY